MTGTLMQLLLDGSSQLADEGLLDTDRSLLDLDLGGLPRGDQQWLLRLGEMQLLYQQVQSARARRAVFVEFAVTAGVYAAARQRGLPLERVLARRPLAQVVKELEREIARTGSEPGSRSSEPRRPVRRTRAAAPSATSGA